MWPGSSGKAIAYVASTLPLSILDIKLEEWNISEVVLQGSAHQASYIYLQRRYPGLKIRVLSRGFIRNMLELFWMQLLVKLCGKRLFFFHECSCPVFDIFMRIIKPYGDHFPQVTLASFVLVSPYQVTRTRSQKLIAFLGMESWFDYYRGDGDNNEGVFFVQAAKCYPKSVREHEIAESRTMIEEAQRKLADSPIEKKIIILCARDVSGDDVLRAIYTQVIDLSSSMGLACYVKDHPAQHARLNLEHEQAVMIDPALPLELIDMNFSLVIGIASTALLHFGERSISLIKLLPDLDRETCDRRVAHLAQMPGKLKIRFPHDLSELEKILAEVA